MPNPISNLISRGVSIVKQAATTVRAVQAAVNTQVAVSNTVNRAADTFSSALSTATGALGALAARFAGAPLPEPLANTLRGINVGSEGQQEDPVGPDDNLNGVRIVQSFLARNGYDAGAIDGNMRNDTATVEALKAFQQDNGLEPTGIVDDATVDAMLHPRPRSGYGAPNSEGALNLSQPLFQNIGTHYRDQLGLATSAAFTSPDGVTVQRFENGSLRLEADGRLSVLDKEGNPLLQPADYAQLQARAAEHSINQMEGDTDGDGNQNCGYASTLMALSYLGVPGYDVTGNSAEENFQATMDLRDIGQPDSVDTDSTTTGGIWTAATQPSLQEAGVQAQVHDNEWNGSREADVEYMQMMFLDGSNPTAFVVAGNPRTGWGSADRDPPLDEQYRGDSVYNGSHFVTVVGYNAQTDRFLVMDPMAEQPIEVSSAEMAAYMTDQGVSKREVLQLTYTPPTEQ